MTINMVILLLVIFIALVVQFVVEAIKGLVSAAKTNWGWKWPARILFPSLNAIFWTVLLCFASKAGLFDAFGFVLIWPSLDYIVTGIIASLGASKVYDLVVGFKDYKDKLAIESAVKKE